MSGVLAGLGMATLLSWVAFAILGWVVSPPLSVWIGGAIGGLLVLVARNTMILRGFVALLAPFGVMLPAIALRQMAAELGAPVVPFATFEILVFPAAICRLPGQRDRGGACGCLPGRLCAPAGGGRWCCRVCVYGYLTGNWFLPLVAVLGQALWLSRWGSSNWFDHVTHVLLVPVALIVLVVRVI